MASINVCVLSSCAGLKSTLLWGVLCRSFVERRLLRTLSIWSFTVATEAGRYLLIFLVVTPGHVVNWLFVIALSHVEGHGLKSISAYILVILIAVWTYAHCFLLQLVVCIVVGAV